MEFRKTKPDEVDRIMEILAEGRESLARQGIDQWQGGYPHRESVEQDVRDGFAYLLDDDGTVVATTMVGLDGERIYDDIEDGAWLTDSTSTDPRYAVFHRVAVSAARAGKGVGGVLLTKAEELAREHGCESARIDTHPGNEPMKRLLRKLGYTYCGIVHIDHAEGATTERVAYEKLL